MQMPDSVADGSGPALIETVTDSTHIKDSNVRQFLELWFAELREGRTPGKTFVDPLRLRFLLGSLSLLEVQKSPLRFRYRVVGTDIVERLGVELTGKWLDEHPNPIFRPLLVHGATMVFNEAKPIYGRYNTRALGEDWLLELVAVPLFDRNGEVAYIGAGQSFPPGKPERQSGLPVS